MKRRVTTTYISPTSWVKELELICSLLNGKFSREDRRCVISTRSRVKIVRDKLCVGDKCIDVSRLGMVSVELINALDTTYVSTPLDSALEVKPRGKVVITEHIYGRSIKLYIY